MAIEPSADQFPPLQFDMQATTDHPTSPPLHQIPKPVPTSPDNTPITPSNPTPVKLEPLATTPPSTRPPKPDQNLHDHPAPTDSPHPFHVTSPTLQHAPASQSQQDLHPAGTPLPETEHHLQDNTVPDDLYPIHDHSEFTMEHRPLQVPHPEPNLMQTEAPPNLPEHHPTLRNPSRKRAAPERLSPKLQEPRPQKVCKRLECAAVGLRNLYMGPDGPATLCYNCYMKYRALRLVVYMDEISGTMSIISQSGMTPMRVFGFEPRLKDGSNDLSRPRLVRLQDNHQDAQLLAHSQMRGGRVRKRRRSSGQKASDTRKRPRSSHPRPLSEGLKEGEGIYVKAEWRSDMRRFRVPLRVTLHAFREELRRVFQWKREQLFCIFFRDEYGDFVRLGEESKMARMFQTIENRAASPIRVKIVS